MMLLTEAIMFAAQCHDGAVRKGTSTPYIVHPMEVVGIAAAMTGDEQVLAAAALHDVMEDCGISEAELARRFGARVAYLVRCETQTPWGDPDQSWNARKQDAVCRIKDGGMETKIIALADKLSNIRAIDRDCELMGDAVFLRFHQHDKRRLAWYYRSCTACLQPELGHTEAWWELARRVEKVFEGVQSLSPDDNDTQEETVRAG